MRSKVQLAFAVALFLSAVVLLAQQPGVELKMQENVAISAPAPWRLGSHTADSAGIFVPVQKERKIPAAADENPKPVYVIASEAGMEITKEHRRDHAEAVRRLAEIASEYPEPVTTLLIAGWPAIERRYKAPMPVPGQYESDRGVILTMYTTTAVAVASTVIRFNTMLAPDADPKLADQALEIGRALKVPEGPAQTSSRELEEIKKMIKSPGWRPAPPPKETRKSPFPVRKTPGVAVQVQTGVGELEVATNDGQHVVVAANSGFSFSDNFGATYTFGGGTPCNQTVCDGDPSLAVGQSGNIYYAWIGGTSLTTLSDGVSRSTTNGHTFTFQGMAATCPGTTACTVADQEHIAADRVNAGASGDRVYNVWRDFGTTFTLRISCSGNNGVTWTGGAAIGAGDFPRVSVGSDGFVYVAWASGGNMMLHKFSNCDAGLTPQVGWPVTVAAFTNVVCAVPGLDRCNGRNILSSPKIAVDDLDPNHIYYAFATSTGAGNEDVMVFDSTNGGATFPRSVRVNNAVTARRYMPWISTYGGIAVVSWYDRRNSTAALNDQTRFFIGGAAVRGPNLVALTEADLSGVNDSQCTNWLCATNATTDSESCSVQPQLAGRCFNAASPPTSSNTPCDFSTPACPGTEVCAIGRGCPKYGDYNGNAAGLGRHYSAWASAMPPTSVGGAAGGIRVYASADRIPSDFYVRDWNDSPTSFDNGAQPSTHANFWSTSDVWNQNTNTAAAPGPGGYVVGDPPSRSGSNFAFARVSRRAAAMNTAPNAPVTVHFLYGDFGLGAAFFDIGSESVTFTAADMNMTTVGHSWSVLAGASNHICLAAQIDGPDGDTFALPSVAGTAPGPADPLILIDNNKAQRNLQDTVGTSAGTEIIAIIGNLENIRRPVRLRLKVPPHVRLQGVAEIVGGRRAEIANDGLVEVGELAPGEVRWLRLHLNSLAGVDKPVPIDVFEDTQPPANGFTVLVHRDTTANVVRRNLLDLANVLRRLAEIERDPAARHQAEVALRASRQMQRQKPETYFQSHATANRAELRKIELGQRRWARRDTFDVAAAWKAYWTAIDAHNVDQALAAQRAVIERLDATLSALWRARHPRLIP